MKGQLLHKTIFILLLLPMFAFAQPGSMADRDITGLWKGSLYNDTTKKNLPYEIAISEEDGKLSGYSYILFDIDGKKELGVKRIKLKRKGNQIFIEDVELISNTYSAPPPRRVRLQSVVSLSANDTSMQLTGKWSTNATREYLPYTGSLQLERALDFKPLILFRLLAALKLENSLSFVTAEKKPAPEFAKIENQVTAIKTKEEAPPIATDPDKPKEITAVEPENKSIVAPAAELIAEALPAPVLTKIITEATGKKTTDLVAKVPVEINPKLSGQIITETPLVYIPAKIITDPFDTPGKKATDHVAKVPVAINPKPSGQFITETSLVYIPTKIITELTDKKPTDLVAKVSVKVNPGLLASLAKNIGDRPKTIVPPVTATTPVIKKTPPVATIVETAKKENKPAAEIARKPVTEKPIAISAPVAKTTTPPAITIKEPVKTESKPITATVAAPEPKKEIPVIVAAANVSERKMKSGQSVFFESDSLVLTLYDNGDVDGDTVSVLMNGQVIFARQGLSTRANSKTIYIDKTLGDSLAMVMYAENLGSIPPNTGLMIVMDGDKRYEVRFSADLKTNAAILLRRRPKEK